MSDVRSRAGVVAVTAGALVLLALPVVAEGQVPVVGQVVGGVTGAAQSVTQQPAPSDPPPAPAAQPPSAPAPMASAPSGPRSAPAGPQPARVRSPRGSSPTSGTSGGASAGSSSEGGGGRHDGAKAASSAARKKGESRAGESAGDDAAAASQGEGEGSGGSVANVGGDSAARLPFTGFELLLVAMVGAAMLAGGAALRHGTRHRRA